MRFLAVAGLALCACGPASHASSTFEGDKEGWALSNNGGQTDPTLERTGGNPAGMLCGRDQGDGDIWYFVAPRKYLGNASAVYGKRLTFDLQQGNIFNQIRGRDVVLNGGGISLVKGFPDTPGTDWTPRRVGFDTNSGWIVEGTNQAATDDDLKAVLRNLTALRIRGEFVDGPQDTACLDNVYLGTP